MRSNYKEGDAFLSGALSPDAAADLHDALCDIVSHDTPLSSSRVRDVVSSSLRA